MNPRFVLWCEAHSFDPAEIGRDAEGVTRIDGTPWTVLFMIWVRERWAEWSASLGFKASGSRLAHEVALVSGFSHVDFDAWLIGAVRCPDPAERDLEVLHDYARTRELGPRAGR